MIDQIRFQSCTAENGRGYEKVTLWIAGVPFSADLSEHIERMCHRIAAESGAELVDLRSPHEPRRI